MTNKTAFSILLTAIVLAIAGCSDGSKVNKPQPPELTERVAILMGGWPHAEAITDTGKATAFRITNPGASPENEEIGPGVALTAEQRAAIAALLARDDAYLWEIEKDCIPMPGVLITFEDGATYARVRFCFSCQILEYRPGSSENFDPINAELIDWVKGVFPEDEAIQELSADGSNHGL